MENLESLPIKEIIAVASPLIKSLVDTFIAPKLVSLKKRIGLDYKKFYVPQEEHFTEYFHRTYKRVSIINTLVFNNSQRLLRDIYVPLTVSKIYKEKRESTKIDLFPETLINAHERILITDTAGMGKSTLMKKIFLECIDGRHGIPILIELRRLTKEKTLLNEIQEQLSSIDKEFDNSLLLELLKMGGFIIILDGYDEISLSEREHVTTDLQNFIIKASENKFIITSRPEKALVSFGDFQEFKIEPLKKKEAYELLRKYDRQGHVSSLLIKKLEDPTMSNIEEFLVNPLLVSLLFTAFQHKQTIPLKKYLFYRQVYDANFESHDLTKGDSYIHEKYSKLEIDDFHRVLRHIGYSCLKNNQRIEFTKDELLNIIKLSKSFCVGLNFNESDFLNDLIITVPLFTKDGNYYRWSHKSLQEYFAAQFIYLDSKEFQLNILNQIYNNQNLDKFINVLDLYYDIDQKTFRNTIIYDLLKTFKTHHDTLFSRFKGQISQEDIQLRKELTFLDKPFLFISFSDENGIITSNVNLNKLSKALGGKISGTLGSINNDKQLFCMCNSDAKEMILPLLYRKRLPFIELVRDFEHRHIVLNIKYEITKEYVPYTLSDKTEDQFNSPQNFSQINSYILYTRILNTKIKTQEALEYLKEIEESIATEKADDFSIS